MTGCNSELPYDFYEQRPLVVQFSDLELSCDAGILLARQAEERIQICHHLAECIEEWRDPNRITHRLQQLVSQRVYQLVGGYEDANDSNILRHDPIYKIACGRLPLAQEELLASQPTITRLENRVSQREVGKMRGAVIERFVESYQQAPEEIVLDIDGWDDPTHGNQQLSCFHGYYGQHMYFPVLINEATSGYPLVLQLRAGNAHPGKGVAGILRWLFWRLKRAFPGVRLILRADAGFALPEILRVCERSGIGYAIGFSRNAVTERKIAHLLERARLQFIQTQQKARLFDDVYYAAASWDYPRRLVMKAEWLPKGANPRFVLTNLELPPQALYDQFYVKRGADSEHRIKELKLGIHSDRLSCHTFVANQFRLLLAQAAYILMLTIRQAAQTTEFATAQVERLRSKLIKGAARVRVSARRVLVELAAHCPVAQQLRQIVPRLVATIAPLSA
ncbi:MAG: IS1380 family transposase [Oculatellaceae cyanobacterium bins.114]|nr:IS1380 family transposase [Oculatellaceae cyanobacterium bins.114]